MSSLADVIHETMSRNGDNRANDMLSVLREHHYWPALQLKKFFDGSGLVLLHNTYKRVDVDDFKDLYDECRSVVLDLDAPEGNNVVVTLSHSIPERLTVDQYKAVMQDADVCETAFEGTVVSVYMHNDKWHFGTTSCPSVDKSRFFHPTKTHGQMLDEALAKMFPDAGEDARSAFVMHLDENKSYAFVLVHHENMHVMNYADEFGSNDYAVLIHIATRDRRNMQEDDLSDRPFADIGVRYAQKFPNPSDALASSESLNTYGFIVKAADGRILKVSSDAIVNAEDCNLGNPNKWVNMLSVYMRAKPHYQVSDYVREYAPNLQNPTDESGRDLAPTYIIHTVMCTMRDILYYWYTSTTVYNPHIGRFRMNKEVDASLPPILRFHLAQLRHLQVTGHAHAFINPRAVYHYICHHQTLKNVRNLISFFASSGGYDMTYNQAQCFAVLNQLLTE